MLHPAHDLILYTEHVRLELHACNMFDLYVSEINIILQEYRNGLFDL